MFLCVHGKVATKHFMCNFELVAMTESLFLWYFHPQIVLTLWAVIPVEQEQLYWSRLETLLMCADLAIPATCRNH
jgi:hypothetical protein